MKTRLRVPRRLDGNLEHMLSINSVRIALALALPALNGELRWWQSDWELGIRRHGRISPDALFAVRWEGEATEQVFSLEVERHTSGPRSVLTKLVRYQAFRHTVRNAHAAADLLILLVGHDAEAVDRCRSSLSRLRLSLPIWFTTLRDLDGRAAEDIWKQPGDDNCYSIRALRSLPYRKEGFETETDDDSPRSAAESARISPYETR